MAANRFAILIHRKTNRITLVLVYAFLEWALIFFLLLNSLFSYLILRFADCFGLKRPCLLCSRLDRFFDAAGKSHSNRDLLCDDHALEISRVPFKPVESNGFVEACLEKTPSSDCALFEPDLLNIGYDPSRSIFVLKEGENVDSQERSYTMEEETEKNLPCENEIVPQFSGKIEEEKEEAKSDSTEDDDGETEEEEFSCYVSSFDFSTEATKEKEEENKMDLAMEAETAQGTDDKPEESAPPRNLEFYIDDHDCHLIPVEFYKPSDEVREISDINGDFILDFAADESKPDYSETNIGSSVDGSMQMQNDDEETDAEVSIGTEIPDHDQIGDIPSFVHGHDDHHHHEEVTLEFRAMTLEAKRPVLNEEQLLEMESFHSLHDAMFHLDRRTESIDGVECSEGVLTVDKLKFELEEERKALNALYEELEEERSASAVAANETMAMINRLQEEKAAMQMEALQYQRMMEEQSEFDQEALQLLNELMVKREKENAELEKELEICRTRLEEYEAKEKMGMLRMRMRDSSVDSYRNNGDSDESNGELHHKDVEGVSECNFRENEMENTPVDVVLRLDECLDDYEGERLLILGRLKFLEEKLTALNDEEDDEKKAKTFENDGGINGNGHFHGNETNGKHKVIKSKKLLPLFDAVDGEIVNGNHHENGVNEWEKAESVTMEEEVDELYERLEALEADREFLRHCVGSLRKGDKGVHLLHEILQHLRDLRNMDLIHVREHNGNMSF